MITIQFVKNVGDFTKGQVASVDENSAEALIRRKDAVPYPPESAKTQGDQTEQNIETEGQEDG